MVENTPFWFWWRFLLPEFPICGQPREIVRNFRNSIPEINVFHLIFKQDFRNFRQMESAHAFHTNPLHLPNVLQTSLQISLRQLYKHGLTYQVNMRQMCLYFANQYLTLGLYIKNRKNTYWVAICYVIFKAKKKYVGFRFPDPI